MPFVDMTKMQEHEFQVGKEEIAKLIEAGVIRPGVSTSAAKDGVVMIETDRKRYERFTREQVIAATEARNVMAMMEHSSEAAFMKHVVSSSPVIKNCQVTLADVSNAKIIFGPERGNVKRKTVRQHPEKVRPVYVSIPRSLFEQVKM